MLSRDGVTIDRAWIANRIYWTHRDRNTSKCSSIANAHNLQLTTARTKFSHSVVFTSCVVTASNAVDLSASVFSGFCPRWLASISQFDSVLLSKVI
jgi:hypothetical protein